jgi:hypothetical protein
MTSTQATPTASTLRTGAGTWHVMTATARGRSHEVRGMPSQDAVAHRPIAAAHGLVVAVADGHGHHRHFRSATGSALAVRSACQAATDLITELRPVPDQGARDRAAAMPSQVTARLIAGRLPSVILRDWRAAVARDVVPVAPDGANGCPVPGDDALDGLHTTSLCQPDALDAFRVGTRNLAAEPLQALMLATDGYGNAQAREPWQPEFARDLAALAATQDPAWFAAQVPSWAARCASGNGSGDDTTIALLLAGGPEHAGEQ